MSLNTLCSAWVADMGDEERYILRYGYLIPTKDVGPGSKLILSRQDLALAVAYG